MLTRVLGGRVGVGGDLELVLSGVVSRNIFMLVGQVVSVYFVELGLLYLLLLFVDGQFVVGAGGLVVDNGLLMNLLLLRARLGLLLALPGTVGVDLLGYFLRLSLDDWFRAGLLLHLALLGKQLRAFDAEGGGKLGGLVGHLEPCVRDLLLDLCLHLRRNASACHHFLLQFLLSCSFQSLSHFVVSRNFVRVPDLCVYALIYVGCELVLLGSFSDLVLVRGKGLLVGVLPLLDLGVEVHILVARTLVSERVVEGLGLEAALSEFGLLHLLDLLLTPLVVVG